MRYSLRIKRKSRLRLYAAIGNMASLFFLAGIYIYSINSMVVGSLAFENMRERSKTMEEDIQKLSAERMRLFVERDLEELRQSAGLEKADAIHYVRRARSVARTDYE